MLGARSAANSLVVGERMKTKYNKCRQCAPSGPDAQTAARFVRRCGKRYVAR